MSSKQQQVVQSSGGTASEDAGGAAAASTDSSAAAGRGSDVGGEGAAAPAAKLSVSVRQRDVGWTEGVGSGETAGVVGKGLRIEAIALTLTANVKGSVIYSVDADGCGWTSWVGDGVVAGIKGKAKQIKALKVQLTGEAADAFDVWCRAWVGGFGWTGWAKNGMPAGSISDDAILEGVEVFLLVKGSEAPGEVESALVDSVLSLEGKAAQVEAEASDNVETEGDENAPAKLSVSVHQQNIGWTEGVGSGKTAGVTGMGLRVEAIAIAFSANVEGALAYCVDRRDQGWTEWARDGKTAGSTGKSQPITAIKLQLTGEAAGTFDVWYRVWVGGKGWSSWVKNGIAAGAASPDAILEGIEVSICAKDSQTPDLAATASSADASEAAPAASTSASSEGAAQSAPAAEAAPQSASSVSDSTAPAPAAESAPAAEPDIVVKFDDVTKTYRLYNDEKERLLSVFWSKKKRDAVPCVNANDHLSFEMRRGDAVAFLGKNGAGKSTALKLVTGVAFPTSGTVTVNGHVSALLELTAGFDGNLTGRENIYLRGEALGMSKQEIAELEPKTVDFADLGPYIDQPVRSYSSGMKARLGFGFAVSSDPEILVVDEALAVGDKNFREKCYARVREIMSDSSVTVLFVTHSSGAAMEFCTRGIVLDHGKKLFDGGIAEATEFYNKM